MRPVPSAHAEASRRRRRQREAARGRTHRGVGLLGQLLLPHLEASLPLFELLLFKAEITLQLLQPLEGCLNLTPAGRELSESPLLPGPGALGGSIGVLTRQKARVWALRLARGRPEQQDSVPWDFFG